MNEELEQAIGYHFRNRDLLQAALTHKSFTEGDAERVVHNERLEFLGDSVLGLVITDHLYRRFKRGEEGDLAKLKSHLVSSDMLFRMAQMINLGEHVILGRGEERNRGRGNKKIVSSTLEALIGAVYIDGGLRAASKLVQLLFGETLERFVDRSVKINDYKSELQEMVQKHRAVLPIYRTLSEPGKPQAEFAVAVYLDDVEIGRGRGKKRREAEQDAARNALQNIGSLSGHEQLSEIFFLKNPDNENFPNSDKTPS